MIRLAVVARGCAALMLFVALTAGAAFGQQVTGTILGRVTDSSGAVVSGASVQIENAATNFSRIDKSDSDGRYLQSNLPLGTYSVTVQAPGFQTLLRNGIELTVGSEVTVNAELSVGNVQEKVEVTADAPAIETSNATISSLVSQEQLRDLPLNGRSVDSLALLTPGTFANHNFSANPNVGLGLHIAVSGARQDQNLYLLDGTITNDVLSGRSSAAGEALGVEGILEFRVLVHNFSAEYGWTAGGVFSAVTRSGTNTVHGSVYEFLRNSFFDARNFFNTGGLPAYRRNQFGAAVGGPIVKNKLFFFGNYEGLRVSQGITVVSSVPDLNARQGFLPCSAAPTKPCNAATGLANVGIAPAVVPYINLWPLPTGNEHGDGGEDSDSVFKQPTNEDYFMTRMDYVLSDKDTLFGRYVSDISSTSVAQAVPTFQALEQGHDDFFVLSETHTLSATSVNEFRASFNRTRDTNVPAQSISIPSNLLFVPGQVFGLITWGAVSNGGTAISQLGTSRNQVWPMNRYEESDSFSKVAGAHSLKFGVELQRQQINDFLCVNCNGQFSFTGLPALLAGTPTNYVVSLPGATTISGNISSAESGWRRVFFAGFAQDDYRIRPNLTLNLGLRYEFLSTPSEINGRSAALINYTNPANTVGPPFLAPRLNFAPRVGLAWDPTGSGKTSIRVAGGVYDAPVDGRTWFSNATNDANFLTKLQANAPPFPNGLGGPLASILQANQQIQYHLDEPTVIQYTLEVQRQVMRTLSLRAAYVGSHSYNLPIQVENNTKIPVICPASPCPSNIPSGTEYIASTATAVNPNFASLQTTTTVAIANYNALQVGLRKSISAGLSFQASYTYSKNLSDGDQAVGQSVVGNSLTPMDPLHIGRDYGLSGYDQRNTFVFNGAYLMPWDHRLNSGFAKALLGGWSINGIFSYGSGLPFSILTGFNNSRNGDTQNSDRPNLNPGFSGALDSGTTTGCPGVPAGQALGTAARWFNPCAFSLNPAGTYGNVGRDTMTGHNLLTTDLALVKLTTLPWEKTRLEFRAECFNCFNHANLAVPVNNIFQSSGVLVGNAGQITATLVDNREIQLGLKLLF